jgi:hypothetical protein
MVESCTKENAQMMANGNQMNRMFRAIQPSVFVTVNRTITVVLDLTYIIWNSNTLYNPDYKK